MRRSSLLPVLIALVLSSTAPRVLSHGAHDKQEPAFSGALEDLSPLGSAAAAGGDGDVHTLGGGRWLVARGGELMIMSGPDVHRILDGRFESLDARGGLVHQGREHLLISAIDADAGAIVILLVDARTSSVSAQRRIEDAVAMPEAACLHREPVTGHVALFSVDARGMLSQRYVFNGEAGALLDLPVRRAVGALDVEACAEDDAAGALYLGEGPLGVWRMDATAESDAARTPVLLHEPWGSLAGEVEDLAVDAGGGIWALLPDAGMLVHHHAGSTTPHSLPAGLEPSGLSVDAGATRTTIALFDESLGVARSAVLPGGVEASPAESLPQAARVLPAGETDPVRRYGDAADDPAIYVPREPGEAPLILGTDKREGLAVYDLDGRQLQLLPVGRVNNVDLLTGVDLGGETRDIAAASNRSHNTIAVFEIDAAQVRHLADIPTTLDEVYGLCMYRSPTGAYVFINDTDGRYEQYRLTWVDDAPGANLVREFRLPSQPEGCVADGEKGRLYMGEEAAGIWEVDAEPDGKDLRKVIALSDALEADVEGMDIYVRRSREGRTQRLLVVSSQGSDSYAIYDLDDAYRLVAAFSIAADLGAVIDGVSETDGLAVSAAALPGYPQGILVVQDGRNRMPDAPQNFKIVDWRAVDVLLEPNR